MPETPRIDLRLTAEEAADAAVFLDANEADLTTILAEYTTYIKAAAIIADNAIVRGDGGARGIKSSNILIDNSDNITGVVGLTASADVLAKRFGVSSETTQSITAATDTITITHGVIRISSDDDYTLTSTPTIASPANDTLIFIYNTGSFTIEIQDQGVLAGSNVLMDGASGVLLPGEMITFLYSSSESAWLVAAKPNSGLSNVGFEAKVNEAGGVVKGSFVFISGATGNFPQVSLGDNTDFSKSGVIGVCQEAKSNNQNVTVTRIGTLTEQNTNSFSEGEIVYLTTAGGYSNVHPTGIDAVIRLGHVVRTHSSQGTLEVNIQPLSVINDHDGVVRFEAINQNSGSSASASITVLNDASHRFSFSITSTTNSQGIEEASLFNEGYGHSNYILNGNKKHRWFTEEGDTHLPANLVIVMELTAAGVLRLLASGMEMGELSDHPLTPVATKGQFWVKDDAPNKPFFTDDAGNDFDLTRSVAAVKIDSFPFDNGATALPTGAGLSILLLGGHTLTDLQWTSKVGDVGAITIQLQEATVTGGAQGSFSTISTLTQLAGDDTIVASGLSVAMTDGRVYRANISANSGSITGGVLVAYGTLT